MDYIASSEKYGQRGHMTYNVDLNNSVNFIIARDWAKENCNSFYSIDVIDLGGWGDDEFARYSFLAEEDAAWFKLCWMKWIRK